MSHYSEMVGGPGTVRFILQPLIATVLGIVHGFRDHRAGRGPYLISLIHEPESRRQRLVEALREIAVPLTMAVAASYLFQYVVRQRIYFADGLLYAAVFVALPYFAVRGLANRLAPRRWDPA